MSAAYFNSRPVGSRVSAVASQQSRPMASKRSFEELIAQLDAKVRILCNIDALETAQLLLVDSRAVDHRHEQFAVRQPTAILIAVFNYTKKPRQQTESKL
jgi:hypothetical protein